MEHNPGDRVYWYDMRDSCVYSGKVIYGGFDKYYGTQYWIDDLDYGTLIIDEHRLFRTYEEAENDAPPAAEHIVQRTLRNLRKTWPNSVPMKGSWSPENIPDMVLSLTQEISRLTKQKKE